MGRKYESYNMVDENGEELWQTADGESIPFSQVTHQHWSNIYWYHKYVYCMSCEGNEDKNSRNVFGNFFIDTANKCKFLMDFSLGQLKKRFDGELLDWVPIYEKEKIWFKSQNTWFKSQNTRKILIEKFK